MGVPGSGNWQVLAWRVSLLSPIYRSPHHSFLPSSLSIFCVAGSVLCSEAFGSLPSLVQSHKGSLLKHHGCSEVWCV